MIYGVTGLDGNWKSENVENVIDGYNDDDHEWHRLTLDGGQI